MGDGRYVRSVERIRPQLVHVYWTYGEPLGFVMLRISAMLVEHEMHPRPIQDS